MCFLTRIVILALILTKVLAFGYDYVLFSTLTASRNPASAVLPQNIPAGSLFSSYEPVSVTLSAPLKTLFSQTRTAELKKQSIDGTLTYQDPSSQVFSIPVEVRVKGNTTLVLCPFPKLELKIKSPKEAAGIFQGVKSVDLGTHCRDKGQQVLNSNLYQSVFNHREALIYRMAEILGVPTYKARPAVIRYQATGITVVDENTQPYQAFFLEDKSAFRKRIGATEFAEKFESVKDSAYIDYEDAARIALFEVMIGNIDWSLKSDKNDDGMFAAIGYNLWNMRMFEFADKHLLPVPYDFNYAEIIVGGIGVDINKNLFNLAERASQEKIKKSFLSKKALLYKTVESSLKNDPEGIANFKKTLDAFYSKLSSY
jgi:hypothetical protein